MDYSTQDQFDGIIRSYMKVEDVTTGSSKDKYILRFRGRIYNEDTALAYDQLTERLKPLGVTPLFRWDGGQHAILLIQGLPEPRPSNPWINLVLFILTVISVLITGAIYGLEQMPSGSPTEMVLVFLQRGWPFAVSMLAILGVHEFGHYLVGRHHGVHVSLPYFIPLPMSPFGTMGAFINMKSVPKNRRTLMDIGLAGPLSGLVIAIPVLWLGLRLSVLNTLPLEAQSGVTLSLEGNSLLYLIMKFLVFGQMLPAPVDYGTVPALIHWVQYFFTGRPLPYGGTDVLLSSVAWAGWAGLLVTGMNLIPAGQLDGGHIIYTLFGRKASSKILVIVVLGLCLVGLAWNGWWLWAALIFFLGRSYAEPLDTITTLDSRRKVLGIIALIVFLLTFVPVPLFVI